MTIDRVTEYARDAAAGRISGIGELHRFACIRHLKDLDHQRTEAFPYYWDAEASDRILRYAEMLTIAEGTEPKPVRLIPSQVFDIGCTFGWMKLNGKRRFRRRYKSMARQNGKTFENGIMGTYVAGFSGYREGKLFTAATKKRQARLAWEEMAKFVKVDPDLGELFSVKDYKSLIQANETGCTIEALSREAGLDDGFRSIFASVDEIHQHRDNKIYKALYNGTRSLPETLVSMITTRGDQLNSFCREMDDYAIQVLRGTSTAEDLFADIYALDPDDDIWDERNWQKANPFLVLDPDRMETLRQDARTARDMGGMELRDFLIKSLNLWVQNTDLQWVKTDDWTACGSDRDLASVVASGCTDTWIGLDLSSGGDLTTVSGEIDLPDGRVYAWSHSFMPAGRLAEHVETDLAPYDLWVSQGLISVTGGSTDFMTDYAAVLEYLAELRDRFGLNIRAIGIDPHNAAGILQQLETFGCPVISVTQSARNLNDATLALQLMVKGNQVEYDRANELLTWSAVNAAIVRNSFDEIKIDKKPGAKMKRIDPIDALIDAHTVRALTLGDVAPVDQDGLLTDYLALMGWKN